MELKILQPKKGGRLKITLQKTGKFGFSAYADELFNLEEKKWAKFGSDDKGNWYIKVQAVEEESCFKIAKAGLYYYINMSDHIIEMGLKKGDSIIFNLIPHKDGFFKMEKK